MHLSVSECFTSLRIYFDFQGCTPNIFYYVEPLIQHVQERNLYDENVLLKIKKTQVGGGSL